MQACSQTHHVHVLAVGPSDVSVTRVIPCPVFISGGTSSLSEPKVAFQVWGRGSQGRRCPGAKPAPRLVHGIAPAQAHTEGEGKRPQRHSRARRQ